MIGARPRGLTALMRRRLLTVDGSSTCGVFHRTLGAARRHRRSWSRTGIPPRNGHGQIYVCLRPAGEL